MIEQALYEHLTSQAELASFLTKYGDKPAIFSQEAPGDKDPEWAAGKQYGRVVFAEDIQGDPERTMGGTLVVDIQCSKDGTPPEEIEPIIRKLIHGYFFSNGTFTVAAQFKNSSYFTEPTDQVIGCTVAFDLLAFPILTASHMDTIARLNEWTSKIEHLHVLNYDALPSNAWQPKGKETAIYWRVLQDQPATWLPDTFQTIWRTATIKGHIFSEDMATAITVGRNVMTKLYADKRLLKQGESPIMVNRKNSVDDGADPLRTGQLTVEAIYGVVIYHRSDEVISNINVTTISNSKEDQNG